MVREVVWSPDALRDLAEIKGHIERSSPVNARKVLDRLKQAAVKVASAPYARRKIPEFDDPTRRETFVHEWRLMYKIEPKRIRIMRIVHGRQLLKNVPGSFEEAAQAEYVAP